MAPVGEEAAKDRPPEPQHQRAEHGEAQDSVKARGVRDETGARHEGTREARAESQEAQSKESKLRGSGAGHFPTHEQAGQSQDKQAKAI